MEAATVTSDLDCSINLPSLAVISEKVPPIPPAVGQSLLDAPVPQPLTFEEEIQDVVLVEQKNKGTQTEDFGKCN